jgi:hypothetical protein
MGEISVSTGNIFLRAFTEAENHYVIALILKFA